MATLAEIAGRMAGYFLGGPKREVGRLPGLNRILQVKLWAIGEVIFTTPAVRRLRKAFPQAQIDYLVGRTAAPVLENNPHIDNLIVEDEAVFLRPQPAEALSLLSRLRRMRYDALLLYHHTLLFNIYFRAVGARILAGIDRRGEGGPLHLAGNMDERIHQADEYNLLPALLGAEDDGEGMEIFVLDEEKRNVRRILESHNIHNKFALIAPGGGVNPKTEMVDKRLPVELFVETADGLRRMGYKIVIVGGVGDEEVCARMGGAMDAGDVVNLFGRTDLRQLFALISLSEMVVANDSACAHAAAALRRPQVTLFGPTSPVRVHPYRNPLGGFVASSLPCAPCYHDARLADCRHHDCLKDTSAEDVLAVVRRITAEKG